MGSLRAVRTWSIDATSSDRAQRRAAAGLARAGVGSGERVAVAAPSSPDVLALVLGALRVGVVPVVVHASSTDAELDAIVRDCEPSLVVRSGADVASLLDDGDRGGGAVELAPVPLARPMHYTSGTSGVPKGVWSGVLAADDAHALHDDEGAVWQFSGDDVLLVASPLHHSAPLRFASGVLLRGGRVVLLERFDAGEIARAVEEHAPTVAFVVPSHLRRLFELPRLPDTSSFRLVAHAGEPCPDALKRRALDVFPAGSVWEFYGSTEGQFTVCGPDEWLARPGTVGRARPRRELRVDADGQIWCKPPPWARFEYWRDPVKTAQAWDGDWFTVGDIGRLDDDGYLFLEGRRDDLVISGGVNVYPAEVERVLCDVAGVEEVVVFGVDDERWGQRVCVAFVGSATDDALRAVAHERLAPPKRPKDYVRVASLPRTSTGKLRRSQLARELGLDS